VSATDSDPRSVSPAVRFCGHFGLTLLCYESMCEFEWAILNALFERLGVTAEINANGGVYQAAVQREHSAVGSELLARCESVYAEFQTIQFRA